MSAILTDHAGIRGRERLGLARAAVLRTAEIALREGFTREHTSGPLRRYCDGLYAHDGKANRAGRMHLRIHGEQVFIFVGPVLVTVHAVPCHLRGFLVKLRKRKERVS